MHRAHRGGTIVRRSSPNLGELRPPPQLTTSTQRQNVDCMEVEAGREEEAAVRAGSRPARRGLPRRLLSASLFIVACTLLEASGLREKDCRAGRRTLLTPRMTELAFARLRTIVRLGEAVPDIPIARPSSCRPPAQTSKMKSTALEKNTTGTASPRRTIVRLTVFSSCGILGSQK